MTCEKNGCVFWKAFVPAGICFRWEKTKFSAATPKDVGATSAEAFRCHALAVNFPECVAIAKVQNTEGSQWAHCALQKSKVSLNITGRRFPFKTINKMVWKLYTDPMLSNSSPAPLAALNQFPLVPSWISTRLHTSQSELHLPSGWGDSCFHTLQRPAGPGSSCWKNPM